MIDFKKFIGKKKTEDVVSTIQDITSPVNDVFSKVNPVENLTTSQKTELTDKLQSFSTTILALLLFVIPIIFVPALTNIFDLPKQLFLIFAVLLLAFVFSVKAVAAKKIIINKSIFDIPILFFLVSCVVSILLSVNRFNSLISESLAYLGGGLLYFAITQTINKEKTFIALIKSLLFSSAALALFSVFQVIVSIVNPLLKIAALNIGFFNQNFSPTGSTLTQLILTMTVIPLSIGLYLKSKKIQDLGLVIINLAGLFANAYTLINFKPLYLPISVGWKIATGTLGQSLNTVFFGVGPSNFVDAFTLYKPMSLNNSTLWNIRFSAGGPFYFYLLTTLGIVGISTFTVIVYKLLSSFKKRFDMGVSLPIFEKSLIASLSVCLLVFTALPSPTVLTIVFFALLGLYVANYSISENTNFVKRVTLALPENFIINSVIPLAIIFLIGFVSFNLGKVFLAEYYYSQSLYAASNNRALDTYNFQIKAIDLNPYSDIYRVAYSQTNLALADSLAGQKDLNDQQKSTVTQLVQQSLREARNATLLQPQRAANWENLSLIYQNLINFAQGADQWSFASLGQAISLDPNNAKLRFDLGSLYFSSKNWTSAAQSFALATTLKNDYANAHYNLAQSLKFLNLKDQAIKELETTAALICKTINADCDKVNNEIESLGSELKANQPNNGATDTLVSPISTPSSANKNLPKAKTTPAPKIGTMSGEIKL